MVAIKVCVGSSCHLKGAHEIVEAVRAKMAGDGADVSVELSGGFCFGKCNRIGVTVAVDDRVIEGITPAKFDEFWDEYVAPKLK